MTLPPILLVDDSPADTELAIGALQRHRLGNPVVALRDGVEALDYLYRRGEFDGRIGPDPGVIVLDVNMPRVGGVEVLRVVKDDPALERIPVVMLTSSREDQDLIESFRLGVNGYVVKPLEFHSFINALRPLGTHLVILDEPPLA